MLKFYADRKLRPVPAKPAILPAFKRITEPKKPKPKD